MYPKGTLGSRQGGCMLTKVSGFGSSESELI